MVTVSRNALASRFPSLEREANALGLCLKQIHDNAPEKFFPISLQRENVTMIRISPLAALAVFLVATSTVSTTYLHAQEDKWVSLFDGKSLTGWEKVGDEKSQWEVKDGELQGSGAASMLVNTSGPYKNFRYRAEVKINDKGNSGLYFRATRKPGFTDGHEAQINSSHTDPIRTGSLYGMCHVYDQLVKPGDWFTYEIDVRDDVWRGRDVTRITVKVNGKELYEYQDFENKFKEGHFAFQQHDPGSHVSIRKVEVQELK